MPPEGTLSIVEVSVSACSVGECQEILALTAHRSRADFATMGKREKFPFPQQNHKAAAAMTMASLDIVVFLVFKPS